MRTAAILAMCMCANLAGAAQISGRIYLKGPPSDEIRAGYVGKDANGRQISCMVGMTIDPSSTASASCDTYSPRVSKINWDPSKGCTFQHTSLPPGTYAVYVKAGKAYLDWKRVKVTSTGARVQVNLSVNSANAGDMSVQLPAARGYGIRLVPLDPKGSPPAGDSASRHVCAETNGINGTATIRGLKAGVYLLKLYTHGPTGSDTTGWYSFRDEPGAYRVDVKAGVCLTYRAPGGR